MRQFARRCLRFFVFASVLATAVLAGTPAFATTYEYDALGRIVRVTYDDGSYVVYTYDAAGNRTVVSGTKI